MGSTSATRSTVEGITVSPFVTSRGLRVTEDDIAKAGQVKLLKADTGDHYITDEKDLTIEHFTKNRWVVIPTSEERMLSIGSADFFTLQEARKGAAAIRIARRRLAQAHADAEAQIRGFESADDEAEFTIRGENLAKVATKLVEKSLTHLDARDLTWDGKINEIVVADSALRWVWVLWADIAEGHEYKAAMARVRESAERVVLQKARYIADHNRREDVCEMQASARVAEGELWGYGYGW